MIFENPEELGETVTVNYFNNKETIKGDINEEKTDLSAKSYVAAGNKLADIAVDFLGPPPTEIVYDRHILPDVDLNVSDINHILAGFIYGMTTQNKLTEIEACYQGAAAMEKEVATAIADFKAGGWNYITQGCLQLVLMGLQMPQEIGTCKGMGDEITEIEQWAGVFTDKGKVISTVTKHFLFHKKEAKADIAALKTDYSAKEFFKVGEDAATLATLLIGPIQ